MAFDSWNQLRELSRLVTPILPDRRKDVTRPLLKDGQSKAIRMIGLASNPLLTDEANVAKTLALSHSKDIAYKVTKSEAKARLLNSCFNLVLSKVGYSEYFQDSYRNDRLTFLAKTLTALGARQAATLITNSAFKESERLELSSNAIETATLLRQGSLLQGNTRQHAFYTSRIEHWFGVKKAELELEGIYDQLRISYSRRAVPRKADFERALTAAELARSRMRTYNTFNVTLFSYRILTFQAQMQQEYRRCIELSDEAETFIRSRETFSNPSRLAEFAIKRLVCSVHLRDFAAGRSAAHVCEAAYKTGTNNWYVVAENYFLLHTACERFADARSLWVKTTSEYNFSAQSENRKNRWAIFGLYLELIEGTLTSSSSIPFSESLQFKDLLSQVPTASVDKAGYNFALVILHILFLIQQQDWNTILDRLDAIKSYRIRHLKSQNSQASIFLQLLVQLEKQRYGSWQLNKELVSEQLLRNHPLDSSLLQGLQIIPFDYLWQWVLGQVATQHR